MSSSSFGWSRRSLSVMEFNVLCEAYEPTHLPGHCKFKTERFPKIFKHVSSNYCDVVCLCECQPVSHYRAAFSDQYQILHWTKGSRAKMIGGDSPPTVDELLCSSNDYDDGQAIMLRRGTVELVDACVIRPALYKGSPARVRQFALVALIFHLPSKEFVVVCTMHMKANRMDSQGNFCSECEQRIDHLLQVLPQLATFRREKCPPGTPAIFCGDFNAEPGSATMNLLLDGRCDVGTDGTTATAAVYNRWGVFESAFASVAEQCQPKFTILDSQHSPDGKGWSAVLDYILLDRRGRSSSSRRLRAVEFMRTPSHGELGNDALPYTGSDHIPIAVSLCFDSCH